MQRKTLLKNNNINSKADNRFEIRFQSLLSAAYYNMTYISMIISNAIVMSSQLKLVYPQSI